MNTTPAEGVQLAKDIAIALKGLKKAQVVVFPPAMHLSLVGEVLQGSPVQLGAQNVHWENSGAFTGELSSLALTAIGCEWVIIGHSERRTYFGETDRSVNKRVLRALETGLRPIVCIGETLEERESGRTFDVLERQLEIGLKDIKPLADNGLVIAYEPVWAIGTGKTATPAQAQEAHRFIRTKLGRLFGDEIAESTTIQYGGSMNEKNAAELLSLPDVDGGLIGGASLKPEKFAQIVFAAEAVA